MVSYDWRLFLSRDSFENFNNQEKIWIVISLEKIFSFYWRFYEFFHIIDDISQQNFILRFVLMKAREFYKPFFFFSFSVVVILNFHHFLVKNFVGCFENMREGFCDFCFPCWCCCCERYLKINYKHKQSQLMEHSSFDVSKSFVVFCFFDSNSERACELCCIVKFSPFHLVSISLLFSIISIMAVCIHKGSIALT